MDKAQAMDFTAFLLRWLHTFAGIIWIGLLYYFNFIQGAFFAETDAATKSNAIQKLVPRALWWFRWAAFWTATIGILILGVRYHQFGVDGIESYWIRILTGAVLGLFMAGNVWFIIWPNQKIVIQSATQAASGGAALPTAAAAGAKALLASRTNTLFSIPMLFFMAAARNWNFTLREGANTQAYWAVALIIILAIEINAIKGKLGVLTTHKMTITCGFILSAIFAALCFAFLI